MKQTNVCHNGFMSSNWSLGFVECSIVNLAEKKIEKGPINLRSICKNDRRKNFWHKELHHKLVQLTNGKQYWRPDRQKLVQMTKKIAQSPIMKKKLFRKKTSSKNHLGHVVSSFDKTADCFLMKPLTFSLKVRKR